ncbi:DNA polymerase III subunit delta' [Carboxydochorda subterranea]|uniref:DNA polymerase III subunit delta n=1 Tax=Carboxydichorda subterranea TaxID=3109565 RepID=A0ABZ1BY61_9FIRM|nr:DNA polymerase III subunit delta' [Limnochorda sp. L945t]WRP17631.1 DNA polymerase III subunit delta' [Limnochorda sp. L945t]
MGHARAVGWFRRAIQGGRIGGAYLLHGPRGVGKATLARAVAAALLCEAPDEDGEACGRCDACQAVARGRHPDVVWVAPSTEAGNITIQQIRDLRMRLSLSPQRGAWTVAALERADRLTLEAANAFLKSLEEPPGQTVLFLLAEEVDALPETIRSRCLPFYLGPVDRSLIARTLEERLGLAPEEARRRALASAGRPGWAMEGWEGALRRRQTAIDWLRQALVQPPARVDRLTRELEGGDPGEVDENLAAMIWLWRDVAAWVFGGKQPDIVTGDQEMEALLRRIRPVGAVEGLRTLIRAREMIARYTSRRLTLNWAWMVLRRASCGDRSAS